MRWRESTKDYDQEWLGVPDLRVGGWKAQLGGRERDKVLDRRSIPDRSHGLQEGSEPSLCEVQLGRHEENGLGFQVVTSSGCTRSPGWDRS